MHIFRKHMYNEALWKGGIYRPVLGEILFKVYGSLDKERWKSIIRTIASKHEKGDLYSVTVRKIFNTYHNRYVGIYSGGAALINGAFRDGPPGVKIGRFCSLASTMRAFNADHPTNWKSTHALFYNPGLGIVKRDMLKRTKLEIGNDVWIGHNVTILPAVSNIADGAIIAAGSIVNQNVPPYAVVGGYPARILRYRFSKSKIEEMIASRWWEKTIEEIFPDLEEYQKPIDMNN